MKNFKRIAGILLALAMMLVMVLPAAALTEVEENTGSILIKNNDTIDASQKKFQAYKILDLKAYKNDEGEIVNYSYSVPSSLADFYAARYGLDKTASDFEMKVIEKIDAEPDIYEFANAVLAVAQNKVSPNSGAAVENGYKFSNLPLGYYIIVDDTTSGDYQKPVSALAVDTATPDIEIEVKAEKPPIDKNIDDDNDLNTTDDRVDANEAAIGDIVTYVIDSKVPDMVGYDKYYFIMKDTLSKGLTYNNDMKITVGDKVLAPDADYTLTVVNNADGTTSMKIVFNDFLQYNTAEFADAKIEVSYTATLNQDAEVNEIPNTNKVQLEYSDNPSIECEGENEPTPDDLLKDPTGETPEVVVSTYTTSIEIVKTDPNGVRLQGAEFTLTGSTMNTVRVESETFDEDANGNYWKLKDGSFTTTDPESIVDGAGFDKSQYASLTQKYTKTTTTKTETQQGENLTITATVGEDGVLRFEGIPSGTYVIKEIKAPEGYNILTDEIEVVITGSYVVGEDGKGTFDYTYEGAADVDGVARVTVVNQDGSELPSTGGTGTTIFYIVGGMLVLAAVVLLVTKKRMSTAA